MEQPQPAQTVGQPVYRRLAKFLQVRLNPMHNLPKYARTRQRSGYSHIWPRFTRSILGAMVWECHLSIKEPDLIVGAISMRATLMIYGSCQYRHLIALRPWGNVYHAHDSIGVDNYTFHSSSKTRKSDLVNVLLSEGKFFLPSKRNLGAKFFGQFLVGQQRLFRIGEINPINRIWRFKNCNTQKVWNNYPPLRKVLRRIISR